MMEAKIVKDIKIQFTITGAEAKWLKNVMQNPLHYEESDSDKEMRKSFWYVIKDLGI